MAVTYETPDAVLGDADLCLLLGGVRAWLFPAISPGWAEGLLALVALAVTGAPFMIPTAAEIPIIQSLINFDLGIGPAASLSTTLPVVNVPSF